MRIAYIDCFAGIAGDMFLGALVDAGVPQKVLEDAVGALNIGASLRIEKVDRCGISSTKVHVMEGDRMAEQETRPGHTHLPRTQHLHKTGYPHTHEPSQTQTGTALDEPAAQPQTHAPVHGRSLTEIRRIIRAAALAEPVKDFAVRAFELLGGSEARIHNVPVDDIHFHEVGAVDAIGDIVGAAAGIHHLSVDAWYCSPINVGGGTVECAHGTFPVPAPATADLLRGFPTYSAHVQKELVTPTGAALIRALNPSFGPQPAMRTEGIGYGAGSRNSPNLPNVVRLSIGEALDSTEDKTRDVVTVLETALDDISPQLLAHVCEVALAAGALDVMLTPVIMKKGRPGTLLTVLCNPPDSPTLERLILRETTTLGLRVRQDRRSCLSRTHVAVSTSYGEIRIKVGSFGGETLNVAPEFEDCRAAAACHDVAVKQVQQAAIAAYLEQTRRSAS